jgi:4'-phosphopantetheinyl transferase
MAIDAAPPVQPWPGPPPTLADGRCVIAIATAGYTRPDARRLARQAITDVSARLLAIAPERIGLPATPGQPQRIALTAAPAGGPLRAPFCSISHETGWTHVAISLAGPVGIDVMAPLDIDDWAALARDYLGPDVARDLAACAPAARARALAQAWTAREAGLKCMGLALAEWWRVPALACRTAPLALPSGLVGALAWLGDA